MPRHRSVSLVALTLVMACRGASSNTIAAERPAAPTQRRFAWNGFACTSNLPWTGEQGTFATLGECERAFGFSCAKTPTLRTSQLNASPHARLDAELEVAIVLMRRGPDAERDDGFHRIAFVTTAPLTDAQREALSCWGVVFGNSVGTVHFGAVAKKALPMLASLPFVERIELQREPHLNDSVRAFAPSD